MAEYIVKSIIKVFWAENSLENLEKIKPKVCKIEVTVITINKSWFWLGDLKTRSKPRNKTPDIEAPMFLSHAIFVFLASVISAKKFGFKKKIKPYNSENIEIRTRLFLIMI